MSDLSFINDTLAGKIIDKFNDDNIIFKETGNEKYFTKEIVDSYINIKTPITISNINNNNDSNYFLELKNESTNDGIFDKRFFKCLRELSKSYCFGISSSVNYNNAPQKTINVKEKLGSQEDYTDAYYTYIFGKINSFTLDYKNIKESKNGGDANIKNYAEEHVIINKYAIEDVKTIDEIGDEYNLSAVKYLLDVTAYDKLPKFKKVFKGNNLKYIFFYFTNNENKCKRLIFSVEEFIKNSGNNKYFYPTIFSWKDGERGTTVSFEYADDSFDDNITINYSITPFYTSKAIPKNKYATVSFEYTTGFKAKDVKDTIIGLLLDEAAISVEQDTYWADKLNNSNKKISFLGESTERLYYYHIDYLNAAQEIIAVKDTYKKPDIFKLTTGRERLPFLISECKAANNKVLYDETLYKIEFNTTDKGIKLKNGVVEGNNVEGNNTVDNLESDANNSNCNFKMSEKGLQRLFSEESYVTNFYLDTVGNITIGYGHTHNPGYDPVGEELRLWQRLELFVKASFKKDTNLDANYIYSFPSSGQWRILHKNRYTINEKGKKVYEPVSDNSSFIKVLPGYADAGLTITEEQAKKLCCNVIKEKIKDLIRLIKKYFLSGDEIKEYENITIVELQKGIKGSNDFIKNLNQEQFDDLVNLHYQGSFGSVILPYLRNNNYFGGSYKKICDGIVACANSYLGVRDNSAPLRNDPFRRKLIRDFTVKGESTSVENNTAVEQEICKIVIAAKAEKKLDIVSALKASNINNEKTYCNGIARYGNDLIKEDHKEAAYYVNVKEEEDDDYNEEDFNITEEDLNKEAPIDWKEIREFVNRWSFNYKESPIDVQYIKDVKGYYDFYSGMTPFVELYFRDDYFEEVKKEKKNSDGSTVTVVETRLSWNVINSIDHPYIKSLKVEDKGVKKAHIQLFDKDFASYQFGVLKAFDGGSNNKVVYSLDTLIKRALMSPQKKEEEQNKEKYDEQSTSTQGLQDEYLKISEYNKNIGPGNLRIRFGYCDDNQPIPKDSNDNRISNYFKTNYNLQDPGDKNRRTHRWWEVTLNDPSVASTFIWKHAIDGDKLIDGETSLSSKTAEIVAATNPKTVVSDSVKRNSLNSTTKITYLNEYMIVGYKTSLKTNGILYDIDAIEVKNAEVMRKRFLQRYAEITTYPLEILYILMHIFNENNDGKLVKSGIKLLFMNDDDRYNDDPAGGFNMIYDFSNVKDLDLKQLADIKDTTTEGQSSVNFEEYLKKATLSFGGETALSNYSNDTENKPSVYKSVESLLNEFCALCASKKYYSEEEKEVVKIQDKDGNEIKTEDRASSVATLSWMVTENSKNIKEDGTKEFEDKKDKTIYVIFYYKRIRKQKYIKRYIWGPTNPYKTIVKDLQIENNNEFAILSSVSTSCVDGSGNIIIRTKENTKNSGVNYNKEIKNIENEIPQEKMREKIKNGEGLGMSYVAGTVEKGDKINAALANCMYTGTMTVLGDPGMEFNLEIQPYTYPIYIEVLVPINDAYWDKEINSKFKEYDKIYHSTKVLNNQKVHEMTGFYVVTSIEHNISASGYTTTLGVSRYPNIEQDVLIKKSLDKYRAGTFITHDNIEIKS